MFLNKDWGNGIVILMLAIMGLFISPARDGLGAFLMPMIVGGVFAVVFANMIFAGKKENTTNIE